MGTEHGFKLQNTKSLGYSKVLFSVGTRDAAKSVKYWPSMWDILWFDLQRYVIWAWWHRQED